MEKANDELTKALIDHKVEIDKIKWQKTILEAEKLDRKLALNEVMESSNKQSELVATLQSENKKLQNDIKILSQEA